MALLFQMCMWSSKFLSGVVFCFNPLNANPTKWSNTLKQFVGKHPTNRLNVFDHSERLAFKGLNVPIRTYIILFVETQNLVLFYPNIIFKFLENS